MAWVSEETAVALAGATVRIAALVEFQFASGTMYLWTGASRRTIGGQSYEGIGLLGSIEGLSQSRAPVSDKVTFRLACVTPDIAAKAIASNAEVRGRMAYVRLQLFDETWQPLGAAIPVSAGIMQRIEIERSPATDNSGGARTASLDSENYFSGRSRPANALYTDAHQKARYPADNGCRFVSKQQSQVVKWPSL